MNKLFKFFIMIGISTFLLQTGLRAQVTQQPTYKNFKKVAQTGFQYLKIGVDARTSAMANVGVTIAGDASNIFVNPAGIGYIESKSVFISHTGWIADMSKQAAGFAMRVGTIGTFGISAANMSLSDIQGTAPADNNLGYTDTGMLNVAEYAVGLSYGKRITDRFTIGGTIKHCYQNLHDESKSVLGFDFGTIYELGWKSVKVGMTVRNFSGEFKYIQETLTLPTVFNVGFSGDILQLAGVKSEQYDWTIALEMNNPRDYSERVHLGTEFVINDLISLRGGYKFNYDEEGFNFGAGLKLMGAEIDYAYSDFGSIFGSVSRFSAQINF